MSDAEIRTSELLKRMIEATRERRAGYQWERDRGLGEAYFLRRPFGSISLSSYPDSCHLIVIDSDGMVVVKRIWDENRPQWGDHLVKELCEAVSDTTPRRQTDVDATLDAWLGDLDQDSDTSTRDRD